MKKLKSTLVLLILFAVGLFATTIMDVMALHDIGNDYISQDALADQQITLSGSIPEWTSCTLEWNAIHFSIILQLILTVLLIFGLIRIIRVGKLDQEQISS